MFDGIFEAIEEWMRELLTGMVTSNLTTMFTDVNEKTGEIATQVGQTPQGWNGSIFSLIQNLSNSVIVPIAGMIITFEETMIDYPVMYHPEEENYYLKRDFNGEYNANGCLFISEACNPDTCDNLIIYGHHMNSGKMFAALEGYKEQDFYEGHPLIIYNTLHGEETYQVMAAFCTPVYTGKDFAYYAFTETENEKVYQSFVDAVRKRSIYDTGITAVYGDKLLTLSTCEYSQKNGRMVVVAKKIKA